MIRQTNWQPDAREEIRRLKRRSREDARRIGRAIDRFMRTGQGDVKKLSGSRDEYRLRAGDWQGALHARWRSKRDGHHPSFTA